MDRAHHVLDVEHAAQVVDVLADHRDAAEPAAQRQRERLADGLGALDPDDVGPRDHDLAGDGVPELEHRVDHVALAGLHDTALLGHVETGDDWDADGEKDPNAGVSRALGYLNGGTKWEREIIRAYGKGLYDLQDNKKWPEAITVSAICGWLMRPATKTGLDSLARIGAARGAV